MAKRVRAQFTHQAESLAACFARRPLIWGQHRFDPAERSSSLFLDTGSDVLGVVHADTVLPPRPPRRHPDPDQPHVLLAPGLDDRLGLFLLTQVLPSQGMLPDILVTTGEEEHASSAAQWRPPAHKRYRWMFSFDRVGTIATVYRFGEGAEGQRLEGAVRAAGVQTGPGSFSDITFLDHLGCRGVNWGTGYYLPHEEGSFADLGETARMVATFGRFWQANQLADWPTAAGRLQRKVNPGQDRESRRTRALANWAARRALPSFVRDWINPSEWHRVEDLAEPFR